MELKSLLVDSKTTWVEFPGLDGFEVELANLSRKELVALRKKCTENKFNRKTRAFEESLDDEKFIIEFTQSTVKGWKGLQLGYLEDLLLVDGAGLGEEGLTLGSLATARAEALDFQRLAGLREGDDPLTDGLALVLLGAGGGLGRHDLARLGLLQVGLLEATAGLHLGAAEDRGLSALALGNDGLLHGALL